jgi:hypothetical protein
MPPRGCRFPQRPGKKRLVVAIVAKEGEHVVLHGEPRQKVALHTPENPKDSLGLSKVLAKSANGVSVADEEFTK